MNWNRILQISSLSSSAHLRPSADRTAVFALKGRCASGCVTRLVIHSRLRSVISTQVDQRVLGIFSLSRQMGHQGCDGSNRSRDLEQTETRAPNLGHKRETADEKPAVPSRCIRDPGTPGITTCPSEGRWCPSIHNPDGRSRKVQGTANFFESSAARAFTPKVSVA